MKKVWIYVSVVAVLCVIASCSRSNSSNSQASNSWGFTTDTYHPVSSYRSGNTVVLSDAGTDTLMLTFNPSIPTASGLYTVVAGYGGGHFTAANQVIVTAAPGVVRLYSTAHSTETVTVTVAPNTGKINAVFTSVQVSGAPAPFQSDTTNIHGNVTEF